jgi:hypothetical protein
MGNLPNHGCDSFSIVIIIPYYNTSKWGEKVGEQKPPSLPLTLNHYRGTGNTITLNIQLNKFKF